MRAEIHMIVGGALMLAGNPIAGICHLLPDVGWLKHEWIMTRAGIPFSWYIDRLTEKDILPYRFTHSLLLWGAVALLCGDVSPLLGAGLHIFLDLFSHSGLMVQKPLWPFPWRVQV